MTRTILALALAALSAPAFANAAITEFPGSGLIFKEAADIAIAREDLFLSLNKVTVHYDYQSDAAAAQTVTIGFPMPPVPINGDPSDPAQLPELEGKDVLNYMQFSASVNGTPVETKLHQFAWLNGEDITARLADLGIPAYVAYEDIESVFGKLDDAAIEELVAAEIVVSDEERSYFVPNWLYQTVYEWQQTFQPGVTKVDIVYDPLDGAPSDYGDEFSFDPDDVYCVTDAVREAISAPDSYYEIATLGYVTTTAQYWAGPIGEFNLTVAKEKPTADNGASAVETAFCGKAEAVETAEGYLWTAKDYAPAKDIKVVWYYIYKTPV